MQSTTIHRIVTVAALTIAVPLGIYGIVAMVRTGPPNSARPSEYQSLPAQEIILTSGDSTDILKALQRLPPEGGRLTLGSGTFPVLEPIIIDRDHIELRGSGPGTILSLTEGSACPVLVIGSIITPIPRIVSHITVSHLLIDGNRRDQDPECWGGVSDEGGVNVLRNNGLTVRGATDITLLHLTTRRARSGGVVLEKNCHRISIDHLESYDNHFDGLACYQTRESTFTNLNLHHNPFAGLSLDWEFHDNTLTQSEFHHNAAQGIFMRFSSRNQFRNLTLHSNGNQGIFIAQADDVPDSACQDNTFTALTINANHRLGIRVNDPTCTGNRILDSTILDNPDGNLSQATPGLLLLTNVTAP